MKNRKLSRFVYVVLCVLIISMRAPGQVPTTASAPSHPPKLMRYCSQSCEVLILKDDHYDAYRDSDFTAERNAKSDSSAKPDSIATYAIEKYTSKLFVLHRSGIHGERALLFGDIPPGGYGVPVGFVTTIKGGFPGLPYLFSLGWGEDFTKPKRGSAADLVVLYERVSNPTLPIAMRFCAYNCFVLIQNGGNYDAYAEGSDDFKVVSTYDVVKFEWNSVILNRTDADGKKAILTASIRNDGLSVGDGQMKTLPASGAPIPFDLSWGLAVSTARRIGGISEYIMDEERVEAMLTPPKQDIHIPPGASPEFKKFPADMRAAMEPEAALTKSQAMLPCDTTTQVSDVQAVEIGKYALRAVDFARGQCWLQRSANMGNVRAKVLLGASLIMGWGVPRDYAAGFRAFKQVVDTTQDLWARYYLEQCYEHGTGTPINKPEAAHLSGYLMSRQAGRDLYMSINADDAEFQRSFQRSMVLLNPPEKKVTTCSPGSAITGQRESCHDDYVVDDAAVKQKLREINQP